MKIFWIFVEQGKIMEAEAPTVLMDATPIKPTAPPTHPHHITPDALPATQPLPTYPGLGQALICAGLHTQWLVISNTKIYPFVFSLRILCYG